MIALHNKSCQIKEMKNGTTDGANNYFDFYKVLHFYSLRPSPSFDSDINRLKERIKPWSGGLSTWQIKATLREL